MLKSLLILAIIVVAQAAPILESSSLSFDSWKRLHSKFYRSPQEEQGRRTIFESNADLVAQMNSNNGDAEYSLDTPFADMSQEEFRSKILMSSAPKFEGFGPEQISSASYNEPLPSSFNWADHGAVGPVKDQGSLGTCYIFSAIETIEGQMFLKKGSITRLSVEQPLECDTRDCGVFGGWPYSVFEYIKKAGGIVSETTLNYCASLPYGKDGNCEPCMPQGYNKTLCGNHEDLFCNHTRNICGDISQLPKAAEVTGWTAISTNETEIAQALVSLGPLSVALNAETLQFYHKGIVDPLDALCDREGLNHAVLLIGFGTEKGLLSQKDYWVVRNSWGAKWGEQGNFRILRGKDKCGIARQVTSATIA